MDEKAGVQISMRAFLQSLIILFILMVIAGVLTRVVPAGQFERTLQDGREIIIPGSFRQIEAPEYPIWRWFTAPFEVLEGEDGLTVIVIILFLLLVGSAFAVLDKTGIMQSLLAKIVNAFAGRKYILLLVVSFFFMSIGAFFGILEEIVPLVPLIVALSYYLGWDALVGLGMSVLAANMGFSAAITNPFTIGVSQKIAGLPLFSGAWLRIPIFLVIYGLFAYFLTRYARRVEVSPQSSLVYEEDQSERHKYSHFDPESLVQNHGQNQRAIGWLSGMLVLILLTLVSSPFIPVLASYALPVVGILFFIAGIGAGLLADVPRKAVFQSTLQGVIGIAPAIPLILMATSVKQIVSSGGILDTILQAASQWFTNTSPFMAVLLIYALALLIEVFVASGSAKAFLIMPIIFPLADLVGVTRQTVVLAYIFGDGFSNMAYPTNPLLLISLSLTVVSYPKWIKWTLPLWIGVLVVTLIFLAISTGIHYGPF